MTHDTWNAVDRYFDESLGTHDDALAAALAASDAAGLPAIAVAPNQGKLLHLLALMQGAATILEVGTLGGYSSIWLARALPEGGRLVTLELDPHHAKVARANVDRAGVGDRVEIRVGPALDTLAQMASEGFGPVDLSFIDADKENNAAYFDRALQLSRSGAVIVVDNVVRGGAVADARSKDGAVLGVRGLVDRIASEPRVAATAIQTVGIKGYDGLLIARVA
ncbi:MAG: O-methyltransferase [Burkholderiaceae bacterium]